MPLNYSTLRKPDNPQIIDPSTGRMREEWQLYFDGLTKRMNALTAVRGFAELATDATTGFLYAPTCAGTPTGTPETQTGLVPIVIDSSNNKLYFYSGGVWRDAGP